MTRKLVLTVSIFVLVVIFLVIGITVFSGKNSTSSDDSVIRLEFRPAPDSDENSALIRYSRKEGNYVQWVKKLDNFLRDYHERLNEGSNLVRCYDGGPPLPPSKVCAVDIRQLNPCIRQVGYSYDRGSPCVFLTLNKIYGWKPQFYSDTNKLPTEMPTDLKDSIISDRYRRLENVWVSCEGENPADKENIGQVSYLPSKGFPGYYFPYLNNEDYLNPVVAVWFEKPARGVLINIVCKAWAQNIHHNRSESEGSVHFQLMID